MLSFLLLSLALCDQFVKLSLCVLGTDPIDQIPDLVLDPPLFTSAATLAANS